MKKIFCNYLKPLRDFRLGNLYFPKILCKLFYHEYSFYRMPPTGYQVLLLKYDYFTIHQAPLFEIRLTYGMEYKKCLFFITAICAVIIYFKCLYFLKLYNYESTKSKEF